MKRKGELRCDNCRSSGCKFSPCWTVHPCCARPLVTKALRHGGTMLSSRGGQLCPSGKRSKRRKIGDCSLASPRHCRASFHRLFFLAPLAAHSCRRRHALRSILTGAHTHFALIGLRARLLHVAERLAAGTGGSATTARTDCQPPSGQHLRPIGNMHMRWAPAFAMCAGNRFIASVGTSIYGTLVPTRMRSGTVHASSHGNSGLRRAITPDFCGACKPGAAANLADAFQCSAPCAECCDAQGACSARVSCPLFASA